MVDIEYKLFKKIFVYPQKTRHFQATEYSHYLKPKYDHWLTLKENYTMVLGYTNPSQFSPHANSRTNTKNSVFDYPIVNLKQILEPFDKKYKKMFDKWSSEFFSFRAAKIITCMCSIECEPVGNPVVIFIGDYYKSVEKIRIHPFKCLTSAHSILQKPLKSIVFVPKKVEKLEIEIEKINELENLSNIVKEYPTLPLGFFEGINDKVSHIHMWCFVDKWDQFANTGWANYPNFNLEHFISICKQEIKESDYFINSNYGLIPTTTDLALTKKIARRGYNECF